MKTKIIYISGNETFEMTQIRAAFEEVRETLGLDKDTIFNSQCTIKNSHRGRVLLFYI